MSKKQASPGKPPPGIISFRLATPLAESLAAAAAKGGVGPHELARQVVVNWLLENEAAETAEALLALRAEIDKLREDLKLAVTALLCDAGKLDVTDAEDWVNTHLFRR
jgi:hypothetical protein